MYGTLYACRDCTRELPRDSPGQPEQTQGKLMSEYYYYKRAIFPYIEGNSIRTFQGREYMNNFYLSTRLPYSDRYDGSYTNHSLPSQGSHIYARH